MDMSGIGQTIINLVELAGKLLPETDSFFACERKNDVSQRI